VHEDEKEDRLERFMELQSAISANLLQRKVNSVQEVIVDTITEEGAIGRSYADSPEIDGVVYIETNRHLEQGDIVKVTIDAADQHDLYASM
jgi:ribosomal protein S12 methylthiotransferase